MARKTRTKHPTSPKQTPKPQFNVANSIDDLRQIIARADALAAAAEELLDGVIWVEDGDDHRRLERLAHLVGATAEAVRAAADAGDELAAALIEHRRGGTGTPPSHDPPPAPPGPPHPHSATTQGAPPV